MSEGVAVLGFQLVQGVSVDNCDKIHSAYSVSDNSFSATVSAELIYPLLADLIKQLAEPVFFFIELPCSEEEEKKLRKAKTDPLHYNLYYLDNCTLPVAEAIMKRYGQLLINDGLCRFGFGSHSKSEEIYCLKYQVVSVFGEQSKFKKCFDKYKIPCEDNLLTLWDTFTNEAPGVSTLVELNGETVYDIAENLKSEGMYLADVIEE